MVSVAKREVVVINNNGERKSLAADWVVLALGMKPVTALARTLEEKVSELYTAGDCECPAPKRYTTSYVRVTSILASGAGGW